MDYHDRKWITINDIDTNPRKGRPKKKGKRMYSAWTIIGQAVKGIEELSPTTPRTLFKLLAERRVVPDTELGLRKVRKACQQLQGHKTIKVDTSVRIREPQVYTTESMIILNPKAVYFWKGENNT